MPDPTSTATTTVDPTAFPSFPTVFGEKEQARMAQLTKQKADMDNIYSQKFTTAAWAKLNPFEKTARQVTAMFGLGGVVAAALPASAGWDYGLTPDRANQKLKDVSTELLGLARTQKVTSLLPSIEQNMALAALAGTPLLTPSEILPGDLGVDFNDTEKAYLVNLAQRLAKATPQEIMTGAVFGIGNTNPTSANTYADQYATMPHASVEQVMSSVAFSKNQSDIAVALKEAFPPSVVSPSLPESDTTGTANQPTAKTREGLQTQADALGIDITGMNLSEATQAVGQAQAKAKGVPTGQANLSTTIHDTIAAKAKDLGITVKSGETEGDVIKAINQAMADNAGKLVTVTDTETNTNTVVTQKSDNTIWTIDGTKLGIIDPKTGLITPDTTPPKDAPSYWDKWGSLVSRTGEKVHDLFTGRFDFAEIQHAVGSALATGFYPLSEAGKWWTPTLFYLDAKAAEKLGTATPGALAYINKYDAICTQYGTSATSMNLAGAWRATFSDTMAQAVDQYVNGETGSSKVILKAAQFLNPTYLIPVGTGLTAVGDIVSRVPVVGEAVGGAIGNVGEAVSAAEAMPGKVIGGTLKYGIKIPAQAIAGGISDAAASAFSSLLDTGIDKWIVTEARGNPEVQSWLSKFLTGEAGGSPGSKNTFQRWLVDTATKNFEYRLATKQASRAAGKMTAEEAERAATAEAVDDTVKEMAVYLLESPEMASVRPIVEPVQTILENSGLSTVDAKAAALNIVGQTKEGATSIANAAKTATAKAVAKAALIPKVNSTPVIKSTSPTYQAIKQNLPLEVQKAINDTTKVLEGQGLAPSVAEDKAIATVTKTPRVKAQINIAIAKEEKVVPATPKLTLKKIAGLEEKLTAINQDIQTFSGSLIKQQDRLAKMESTDADTAQELANEIIPNLQTQLNELVASKNETVANLKTLQDKVAKVATPKVKPATFGGTINTPKVVKAPKTPKITEAKGAAAVIQQLGKPESSSTNSVGEAVYNYQVGDAKLMLMTLKDGSLNITNLKVGTPGKGTGTALLKRIIELADKYGVKLNLVAASNTVQIDKLVAWYEKNGFVRVKPGTDNYQMVREPQEAKPYALTEPPPTEMAPEPSPGEVIADEATHTKLGRFEYMLDSEGRMMVCE